LAALVGGGNMSSFTSELLVSPMPDGRRWELERPFTYHVGSRHSREKVRVPVGFITDFASVPSFLWWLIPPWGKYGKAAIIHDYIYQHHGNYSRRQADNIFLEAMTVLGVKNWRKYPMYLAVRIFGHPAWR